MHSLSANESISKAGHPLKDNRLYNRSKVYYCNRVAVYFSLIPSIQMYGASLNEPSAHFSELSNVKTTLSTSPSPDKSQADQKDCTSFHFLGLDNVLYMVSVRKRYTPRI